MLEKPSAWASPTQLAAWLQLTGDAERQLRQMRKKGTGPKFVRIGREIRYAWADVHAWANSKRKQSDDGLD